MDIGCANGRYFINVASFGMFTKVAHSTDQNQKNALGMLAYYLKVLRDAPSELATSFQLEFTSEEASGSGEYHLCIVSNSMSVGSIRYLMNQADVTDGVFDVLMLKKKRLLSVLPSEKNSANLTLDIESLKQTFPYAAEALSEWKPQGENDPMLIYFQTKHIEFRSEEGDTIVTDLDGEDFGTLPLTIDVAHHAIKLLVPKPSGNTDWLSNGISLIWPPRTATNNTKKERSSGQ